MSRANQQQSQNQSQSLQPTGRPSGGESERSRGITRRESIAPTSWFESPFTLMRRVSEDMDRLFEDFTHGRSLLPSSGRSLFGDIGQGVWSPPVELFERDNNLIARADLPGLNKNDVKVEVTDDAIVLQGERRQSHEENKEGVYHSECSYGSFYRSIPLPEGVDANQAKASFRDGVLEVSIPAPNLKKRAGKTIEITED